MKKRTAQQFFQASALFKIRYTVIMVHSKELAQINTMVLSRFKKSFFELHETIEGIHVLCKFENVLSFRLFPFCWGMYGYRLLCILFHAFADRNFFLVFLCTIELGLRKKEINKFGIAVAHHKVNTPILAEAVWVLVGWKSLRPGFVIVGNVPIPVSFNEPLSTGFLRLPAFEPRPPDHSKNLH